MVLRDINRTVWGTRLLLTPVLASFVGKKWISVDARRWSIFPKMVTNVSVLCSLPVCTLNFVILIVQWMTTFNTTEFAIYTRSSSDTLLESFPSTDNMPYYIT